MEGMLATGRVQRPHGVKGYLRIESFSGELGHILKLKSIVLENAGTQRSFAIEDSKKMGNRVLLKLEGIDSPEEGKRFSNWIVWVARKKAASRRRVEYYAADLAGCAVMHGAETVGSIEAVCDSGSDIFLEIRARTGGRHLLPFTERYFGEVDIKRQQVELRESWLLE